MCPWCCSCTSWLARGKVWCTIAGRINVPIVLCLSLLHNQLPLSTGLLSSPPPATSPEVWHNSPDISQEADWTWCCCCYACRCSVLRRPQPWEHGALRNVSKYSFRLTPFLPLSSKAATPPLLLNLGHIGTVASRLKKPTYLNSVVQVWITATAGARWVRIVNMYSIALPEVLILCPQ